MPAKRHSTLFTPAVTDPIASIADWVELLCLSSGNNVSRGDLVGWLAIAGEKGDFSQDEDLDEGAENLIGDVFAEIERRGSAAAESYPFGLNEDGSILSVNEPFSNEGKVAYLYGLFATACTNGELLSKEFFDDTARKAIPEYLQICAAISAAGLLTGGSCSFGWPRPKVKRFSDALRKVVNDHVQEGEVRKNPRPGSAKTVKDAGIDIIAWRGFPDGMPGKLILFGQCASGGAWKDKGTRTYVKPLFSDFFDDSFPSEVIDAIFIPRCICVSKDRIQGASTSETISGLFRHYTTRLGIVVDRCRLAHLLPKGLEAHARQEHVDRVNDFGKVAKAVKKWSSAMSKTKAA